MNSGSVNEKKKEKFYTSLSFKHNLEHNFIIKVIGFSNKYLVHLDSMFLKQLELSVHISL